MFDLLFAPARRRASTDWSGWGWFGHAWSGTRIRTNTGVVVNEDLALTYSAVWCATRILSEPIGGFPLELFRRKPNDDRAPATDHPVSRFLRGAPNDSMTWGVCREGRTAHQINWGQGFLEIERARVSKSGRPGEITAAHPVHPSRVRPVRPDEAPGYDYWVRNNDGTQVALKASEMLHVPGTLSEDGIWGKGVIPYARESVGMGIATERHGATTFGTGNTPRVALTGAGFKDKDARTNFRQEWRELHGHPDSGEVAIIPANADMKIITIPNEANQYLGTRKFNTVVVSQWYKISPRKLGEAMEGGAKSTEQEGIEFVIYSLLPWTRKWEDQLGLKFLSPEERDEYYFAHDFHSLMRGDMAARMGAYKVAIMIGVLTINECRRLENNNGIGPAGDQHFIPLNMTTAEKMLQGDVPPKPAGGGFPGIGSDQSGTPADEFAQMLAFDRWTRRLKRTDRQLLAGHLREMERDGRRPAGVLALPNPYLCDVQENEGKLLDTPDVRQDDGSSCGATAAMIAGRFFGVGPEDLESWKQGCKTTAKDGTHPQAIIDYLRSLGLVIEARPGMTVEDLEEEWEEGCPVICPVQDSVESANRNGHYVVVRGVGLGSVFVQDPASGRQEIATDDWVAGWHDKEADGTAYEQFGIVVNPPDEDENATPVASAASREAARAVLTDALSRLLTKEANAATRAAKAGGDFLAWIADFYPRHQLTAAAALEPAAAVLAAIGVPTQASALASKLTVESQGLLREAYDSATREQFAVRVAAWPTDRVSAIAAAILAGRYACGGPGSGVPGPCKGDEQSDADKEKDRQERYQAAVSKVADSLRANTTLSVEQRKEYYAAAKEVLNRMPAAALERYQANVREHLFFSDSRALTDHVLKDDPGLKDKLPDGYRVGGSYDRGRQNLELDSGTKIDGKPVGAAQAYAHEFGHAVDGAKREISSSPEWQAAYKAEIGKGGLSKYAITSPHEGFAEFARASYGGYDRGKVEKAFPKCVAVFKDKGLWQ